jgi:hypothetical protein
MSAVALAGIETQTAKDKQSLLMVATPRKAVERL